MDVTDATKDLIQKVQGLKQKHSDPVSSTFINFYCQCHQGADYLFPEAMRSQMRLLDILNWFCECVDRQGPPSLIRLMWQDVVGPTWEEYRDDESAEQSLRKAFESGALKLYIQNWDRERNSDGTDHLKGNGSVHLILRDLLTDIYQAETKAR